MPLRAPGAGFRVENGRVNERDFEKWARDTDVVPTAGTVTSDMLAPSAQAYIDTRATTASSASITALKAEINPLPQYATDVEASALASAAESAAIASSAASLAAHVAAADPHTQYLTKPEGDSFYLPVGTTTTGVAEGTNQYFTGARARAAAKLWSNRIATSNTTVTTNDDLILVDASGGAVTVNLPSLATSLNFRVMVKKIDSSGNAVTIDANSTEQIDGATTQTITTQWAAMTLVASAVGTMWYTV